MLTEPVSFIESTTATFYRLRLTGIAESAQSVDAVTRSQLRKRPLFMPAAQSLSASVTMEQARMQQFFRRLSLVLAASSLAACATWPDRPVVTARMQLDAQVPSFDSIRLWTDAPSSDWVAWRGRMFDQRKVWRRSDRFELLVLSSGSDKGAFSAGFLNGWSQAGSRPRFDMVSGVSTGALIAPFAFLGEGYDAHLSTLYTGIRAEHIYRMHPIEGLLGGASLADTRPLAELIALYVDDRLLDAIAAEHDSGRRLVVQTTNLDAERGVVWDMGAIAASDSPQRLALFRKVLLASASIPGFFPPVLIRSASGSEVIDELHVDGGTTSSVFAIPPAILFDEEAGNQSVRGRMTILYNGALEPSYTVTEPRTFSIMERALSASIKEADRRAVAALRAFSTQSGMKLEIHALGTLDDDLETELFDQSRMREMYEIGVKQGRAAYSDKAEAR
jgi:predicted acylesterase/phospholipase RssA